MKRKLITSALFIASIMGAFLLGKSQAKTEVITTIPENYINTQTSEFINNYIDMREVSDFSATETGLQLYLEDGNGYYWER